MTCYKNCKRLITEKEFCNGKATVRYRCGDMKNIPVVKFGDNCLKDSGPKLSYNHNQNEQVYKSKEQVLVNTLKSMYCQLQQQEFVIKTVLEQLGIEVE